MPSDKTVLERLKKTGCRIPPQRLLVLETITNSDSHIGANDIFEQVSEHYPNIDITTVYRILKLFKKEEIITEVTMNERKYFELIHPNKLHHHMVCSDCTRPFDLHPGILNEMKNAIEEQYNFNPDFTSFTISGLCSSCKTSSPK